MFITRSVLKRNFIRGRDALDTQKQKRATGFAALVWRTTGAEGRLPIGRTSLDNITYYEAYRGESGTCYTLTLQRVPGYCNLVCRY